MPRKIFTSKVYLQMPRSLLAFFHVCLVSEPFSAPSLTEMKFYWNFFATCTTMVTTCRRMGYITFTTPHDHYHVAIIDCHSLNPKSLNLGSITLIRIPEPITVNMFSDLHCRILKRYNNCGWEGGRFQG